MADRKSMISSTRFIKVLLILISLLPGACVTTTDSALTRRADPVEAVERYVQLGLEYIKRDDYSRARKHLTRALEIDEDSAGANAALGLIYHEEGDNALAEEAFEKALDNDPEFTQGRSYYGAFLFSLKQYQKALTQFEIAAKDIDYAGRNQVFTNVALCNLKLGNKQAAIQAYDRALKLDRFNGRALAGVTELYIDQQDFNKAQYYYNRMVRMIRQQGLTHTARSLWMGIRIARHFQSIEQVENLAMLLETLYPESEEYNLYQSTQQKGGL